MLWDALWIEKRNALYLPLWYSKLYAPKNALSWVLFVPCACVSALVAVAVVLFVPCACVSALVALAVVLFVFARKMSVSRVHSSLKCVRPFCVYFEC